MRTYATPLPKVPDERITLDAGLGPEDLLHVRYGQGDDVFVAWHGISANPRLWLLDTLWSHGQVDLVSLPGHGLPWHYESGHEQHWNASYFIRLGIQFAERYSGRPLTLLGHSTGGMIALGVALARPELVKRLILVSPVIWGEFGGIVGLWARFVRSPRLLHALVTASLAAGRQSLAVYRHSLRAFVRKWGAMQRNLNTAPIMKQGYPYYLQTDLRAISGTTQVIARADLRPQVRAQPFTGPTLVVHGMRDQIVPFKQGHWIAKNLPNATLAAIPGIGHLPYAECEPLFNRWLESFLERWP